ncbi:MAG: LptF/LptG family permease [Alphaproteobacteria bacterium]|jgi:lipopolysaccharide export system permease protein|nr:LptF/LptG family permease [Alphaproteobacteria bacterium]
MLKKSQTLSLYIAKKFLLNFLVVFATLLAIIYMFDTIELIRKASKIETDVPMSIIFKMSLYKLPDVGQTLFSFAMLFAAMVTFWRFTRNYELIVARSFGMSIWQILSPAIMVTLIVGLLRVGVVQHYGSTMLKRYNQLQTEYLGKSKGKINISSAGLWFKDGDDHYDWIVNAESIENNSLNNVKVMYFDKDYNFVKRLDADKAILGAKRLELLSVWVNEQGFDKEFSYRKVIPSKIKAKDIEEIMIDDPQISVWNMPHYIRIVKNSGLDSNKIQTNFFSLLLQPVMFLALVLLGVSFSLTIPRKGGVAKIIGIGIFISFSVFFLNEVVVALGVGGKISPYLAASIPSLISLFIGILILLKKEDG